MNLPDFMEKRFRWGKNFVRSHKILVLCTLIGCVGGIGGFLAGLGSGIFVQLVANRILEEKGIRRTVENGGRGEGVQEPFPGALYLCALGVYSSGDAETAALQAKRYFGQAYQADWQTLCRGAGNPDEINGDFMAECLAATLLKSKENTEPLLRMTLQYLQTLELQWDARRQGEKPSAYLSIFFDYTLTSDQVAAAYKILGLSENASLDQVKAAHRRLAAAYHPDSQGGDREQFEKVQNSYEIIMQSR